MQRCCDRGRQLLLLQESVAALEHRCAELQSQTQVLHVQARAAEGEVRAMELQVREAEERAWASRAEAREAAERARASEAEAREAKAVTFQAEESTRQAEEATRQAEGALEDARECRICFAVFDSGAHAQAAPLPSAHMMCMVYAVQVQDSPGQQCHVCDIAANAAPLQLYSCTTGPDPIRPHNCRGLARGRVLVGSTPPTAQRRAWLAS